jgi:hypothetical protein
VPVNGAVTTGVSIFSVFFEQDEIRTEPIKNIGRKVNLFIREKESVFVFFMDLFLHITANQSDCLIRRKTGRNSFIQQLLLSIS